MFKNSPFKTPSSSKKSILNTSPSVLAISSSQCKTHTHKTPYIYNTIEFHTAD